MSKYKTIDVWKRVFGAKQEAFDYTGRLMKKSACGNPNSAYHPTLDHIRPLSAGGCDVPENIIICHRDTNEEKATITGDQNEFTQEQVEATWFSMCMRMQNKLDFIGLANRMKSIVPKITNYPQIEVIINNQLLLDDVLNIKNRILKTFVLGLHNSELSISYRLADQEEVGKVLTKNEVLELLMEKNPAMKKLTKDLDLVMT